MDLQTRKLNIIEYLIGLRDEKIFDMIESTIIESKSKQVAEKNVKPLSKQELIDRAKKSSSEYNNGKFVSQSQLEKESKNW